MADLQHKSWSDLPIELLILIFQNLKYIFELQLCLGVCRSWRSAAKIVVRQLQNTPLLLLPSDNDPSLHKLFSNLGEGKRVSYTFRIPNHDRWDFLLYYRGWFLIKNRGYEYSLYNPVTAERIRLSYLVSLPTTYRFFLMSHPPTDPKCVIFLASNKFKFAFDFCKLNDKIWGSFGLCRGNVIHSMVYYKGQFLVVYDDGALFCFNPCEIMPHLEMSVGPMMKTIEHDHSIYYYLVQSGTGELLMVEVEHVKTCRSETPISVRIFKLNNRDLEWEEVSYFDEDHQETLFLARNSDSICVSTKGICNYKPNCIYFVGRCCADDIEGSKLLIWVYDLRNLTLEQLDLVYSVYGWYGHWFRPMIISRSNECLDEVESLSSQLDRITLGSEKAQGREVSAFARRKNLKGKRKNKCKS